MPVNSIILCTVVVVNVYLLSSLLIFFISRFSVQDLFKHHFIKQDVSCVCHQHIIKKSMSILNQKVREFTVNLL